VANLTKVLVVLAAIGFIMAVITAITGVRLVGVSPEGYSRACSNLALLAIAMQLVFSKGTGKA
jgi:hypothetical protein